MFEVEGLSDAEAREFTTAQYGGLLTPDSAGVRILFEAMRIDDPNAPGRDQFEVARRVEVARCGTRLPVKKRSSPRLGAKVREAMTMTDGAKQVAEGFAATGGVARGADLFEQRVLGLHTR